MTGLLKQPGHACLNDLPLAVLFGVLCFLLLLSAFFSGSETALMTLNRYRLRHLAAAGHPGARLAERLLSKQAFQMGLPGFGNWIVTLGIILFTFSTIIGWSYYGDRSVGYLFGTRGVHVYRWIYILLIPIGAAMKVSLMWTIADITNGLMAFPNLVGLIFLSPVMVTLMKDYFSREQRPLR